MSLRQFFDFRNVFIAYSISYNDETHVVPAFRGSLPIRDFIQPRTVLVDGELATSSGNPLLTPKGTTQLFIYQVRTASK